MTARKMLVVQLTRSQGMRESSVFVMMYGSARGARRSEAYARGSALASCRSPHAGMVRGGS
ncbi:MAG: hypothetical protein ACK56I_32400, partial [bacterium]